MHTLKSVFKLLLFLEQESHYEIMTAFIKGRETIREHQQFI